MVRIKMILCLIVLAALVAGCTTQDQDQVSTRTPTGDGQETPLPLEVTPGQVATATVVPGTTQEEPLTANSDRLDGTLYFIGFNGPAAAVFSFDLANGEEEIIFTAPENAWLSELALSPDGSQMLLAYSPPPEEGQLQYGFTGLYIMPADGSEAPEPLLQAEDPSETYFNISWPVADYIYYAHFLPTIDEDGFIIYASQVERSLLPEASREVLALNAAWPRASDDGAWLAYVTDINDFILAKGDGSDPQTFLDADSFSAVDAPLFSPDNSQICFSAVDKEEASAPSLFSRLVGVKVAYAHNVPSDWWCAARDGSEEPFRLTNLEEIGFYGDFSANGAYMAFLTTTGLYVMRNDGSELRQIQQRPATGNLNWLP